MTPPLHLVDELPAGELAELAGAEGRHAVTVRRTRVGERLLLGDGRGGLADAEVTEVGRDALTVRILARRRVPAPRPTVTLAQALVKGDRGELAVELATEAGVDAILPWRAARCVARWDDGPRGAKALARWRSTVRAAAKQSRRAWLPEIGEPVGTDELAAQLTAAQPTAAFVLHESADLPIATAVHDLGPDAHNLLLIVGPEGGITDDELATLRAAGARAVRLGPEVLRASTAATVALAAIGVLTDRWTRTVRNDQIPDLVRSSERTV
ncbi:16S rRNA (uracil(1498)-N(3))-methyltransferase [Pseudonocardia acaciae]|uniref:16S rRNA (uracil(1498)-N(3))-methyltransferase n=1 Tax=Pseudonocardia acaciae TaxID=551276 RepID=UPI000684E717|nr:16S rRNA (uracil(1498)-N(3))-methyltransferase [Pseudonocardia acaciae]